MKRKCIVTTVLLISLGTGLIATAQIPAPPPTAGAHRCSSAELDKMLGPIALYPDPLIAQILPASTMPAEIVLADRYVGGGGDANLIDQQPWDNSVKALARYASVDRSGNEVLEYAQHLRSPPGTHDGLYWSMGTGDELSPLGPLVAQARVEGYRQKTKIMTEKQSPFHGYYFKILTQQGKHAAGGKYNYIINGHMIGGFALVAWPAEWGNTGVMTFIVNQQGKVYERNLGSKTSSIANEIASHNPDSTWTVTKEE